MSRARLYFKGLEEYPFSKDFDDYLSFDFVRLIGSFIKGSVDFKDFVFYTFSDFVVEREVFYDDFVFCLDGIVSVVISSVDELFIKDFISFLFDHDLVYKNNALSLFKFEFIENVSFDLGEAGFVTRSPICLKKDLFGDDLFSRLEWLLEKGYCLFHHCEMSYLKCEITTRGDFFEKYSDGEGNVFYLLDLFIEGDEELISFAYDVGLGEDSINGFGMLDLY